VTRPDPTAVYVVGAPGVGKTTLMHRLLAGTERGEPEPVGHNGMRVEPLRRGGSLVGVHVGVSRPDFGGTDALGMAVAPDAVRWLDDPDAPYARERVWGEGARLGIPAFLRALAGRGPTTVVLLTLPPDVLAERHAGRGSAQDETWRKGAATRAENAAIAAAAAGAEVWRVDASGSPADVEDALPDEVRV
jgi:hypothetical protein